MPNDNDGINEGIVNVDDAGSQPIARRPINDPVSGAIAISSLPFNDARNTIQAWKHEGSPLACVGYDRNVWYKFTPSANTLVTATTEGSDYDTVHAVYTRSSANFTQVACNDDSGGATSEVAFEAAAGTTHYLTVGSFNHRAAGNLRLSVTGTV